MSRIMERETGAKAEDASVKAQGSSPLLWALGGFVDAMIVNGLGSLVPLIYVNALNVNAALVNLAFAVPRFMDTLTDPMVGHLSDNTRSRWGRRRPWMLAGLIVSAVLGVLLWFPPRGPGGTAPSGFWPLLGYSAGNPVFWYLALMGVLLFAVGYAMFNITHVAMGYEMTTDYNQRTHLFKWRYIAFATSGFVTPWFYPLAMALEGSRAQVLKGSHGVVTVSLIIAALLLLTGLPSVLFCKEKVAEHKGEEKVRFLNAVKMTLGNRPFWLLVVSNFVTKFGMNVTGIFFAYIFLYHIAQHDQKAGSVYLAVFFTAIGVANLLAMSPVAKLTDRLGKKPCLLTLLTLSGVAYASVWFTFTNAPWSFLHWNLAWGGTLSMQWPSLISAVLIGVFTNTIPMINNSMLADVCDLDELTSGHRREAFYGAVFVTIDKMALAVSGAFQGFLLVASGFNSTLNVQPWGTIRFWLLALVITQPLGFLLGSIAVFLYPLTRDRCHEIRNEIEAKRAGAAQAI